MHKLLLLRNAITFSLLIALANNGSFFSLRGCKVTKNPATHKRIAGLFLYYLLSDVTISTYSAPTTIGRSIKESCTQPTTNENLMPKAFEMSMNVESCMSVWPCSSDDMYSRFLPMRSPSCCWVSFWRLRSSRNSSAKYQALAFASNSSRLGVPLSPYFSVRCYEPVFSSASFPRATATLSDTGRLPLMVSLSTEGLMPVCSESIF